MENKKRVVLFQGDSITDAGRDRDNQNSLGGGYAMMAASMYQADNPKEDITFINKGISGNRAVDLKNRWDKDCIDLKPDVVSILIGVNDVWRKYDDKDPTSAEDFYNYYDGLLNRVMKETEATIILCEPFLLHINEERASWREDLDPKIQVVRTLARKYKAFYVPFDGLFSANSVYKEPGFWAGDGVHPSLPGHALMAREWLKVFALIK